MLARQPMTFALTDLAEPIVLAPMAGGPSTPALAAAVSNAGGLGFIAGAYRTADALRSDIAAVRAATQRPFGVNLFVPTSADDVDLDALETYARVVRDEAERYGVAPGEPRWDDDGWAAKLTVLRDERPAVASFTFGCPSADVIATLRDVGIVVWVTVTGIDEARHAVAAGAGALVVQGVEAGGHRASFVDRDGHGETGLLALLRLVARSVDVPLIATGGIADGRAIAAVIVAGASAAQLGSAFLRATEAGTSAAHRAWLAAADRPTALTRAFTGRRARGIVNRFLSEHSGEAPSAYPQVHHLTAPLRAAARERGDADLINLWAGQAYALAEELPAGEIFRKLAREYREALDVAQRVRASIRSRT